MLRRFAHRKKLKWFRPAHENACSRHVKANEACRYKHKYEYIHLKYKLTCIWVVEADLLNQTRPAVAAE